MSTIKCLSFWQHQSKFIQAWFGTLFVEIRSEELRSLQGRSPTPHSKVSILCRKEFKVLLLSGVVMPCRVMCLKTWSIIGDTIQCKSWHRLQRSIRPNYRPKIWKFLVVLPLGSNHWVNSSFVLKRQK